MSFMKIECDFPGLYSSSRRSITGTEWLPRFICRLSLRDVRSFGVFYMWTNNRTDEEATFEKLDRAMANRAWMALFPKAVVLNLPIQRWDHSPIVIDLNWEERVRARPKRFEEVWLKGEGVRQIIARVWGLSFNGSSGYQLIQK